MILILILVQLNQTTANNKIGSFVRKFKLDEITQVINVFTGQMSFVGPRPNIIKDVEIYTSDEEKLLLVHQNNRFFLYYIF